MLDRDAMAEVEGAAGRLLRRARVDATRPVSVVALCVALLGSAPRAASIEHEATVTGSGHRARILVRRGTSRRRARWLVGHEIAEWYYAERGYDGADIERRCDALGAALVAPRAAYLAARDVLGDDTSAIARALGVTESTVLLREGEVTGAPVLLVRRSGPAIARGEPYAWDRRLDLASAERLCGPGLAKVRIFDEPGKIGLRAWGGAGLALLLRRLRGPLGRRLEHRLFLGC